MTPRPVPTGGAPAPLSTAGQAFPGTRTGRAGALRHLRELALAPHVLLYALAREHQGQEQRGCHAIFRDCGARHALEPSETLEFLRGPIPAVWDLDRFEAQPLLAP